MQYGFYYDQTRCVGCNTCSVSCKDFNQINPGPVRWRTHKLHRQEIRDGIGVFENLVMSCNHCAEPACVTACPINAISKDDKGIVTVDKSVCQGYRLCITACPFATPKIMDDRQEPEKRSSWVINHPVQKCKYCWERVNDNETPICVQSCPMRAMDYGDLDDLMRKYPDAVRLNSTDFPYVYLNNTRDTQPSFIIKKRPKMNVTEIVKVSND
jgi:anaerobic dimethyl sulfoxide reductase subunit B (iron-sulfur subunit)